MDGDGGAGHAGLAGAADQRALTDRVRRFQFTPFDARIEEWRYYIRRFERELSLNELLAGAATEPHRRDLLVSRVGPDAFKVLVDHFQPAEIEDQTYINIKAVLQGYYQANICVLAERVAFTLRHRKESETLSQYINALRALASNCEFGASLNERLRDQMVIGISNDGWQKEIFRVHPTNAASFNDIEATTLILEQATWQQKRLRLHSLTKGGGLNYDPSVHRISAQKSSNSIKVNNTNTTSNSHLLQRRGDRVHPVPIDTAERSVSWKKERTVSSAGVVYTAAVKRARLRASHVHHVPRSDILPARVSRPEMPYS